MIGGDVMAHAVVEDWIPRPGTVIDGRYRIEALVGNGTMGAVIAARHLVLDRRVAIKLLRPERALDPIAVERFRQEASAASRIRSDHVVRIHDVGSTDRALPFMAMELLEGIDLEKLAERGPLPIQLAADCVLQAAEALAEAHAAGIVHRDIKPSNLFLTERADGSPLLKVLDFGISKLAPERGGDPSLTETQAMIGSPAYMAPEQIRVSKYVNAKADVWALGVVLFEILTTKLPFDGNTVGTVLTAVTTLPPASLRALRPEIPEPLEAAVFACLDKDPATRATLGDLAATLRPFASPIGAVSAERVTRMCGGSAPSLAGVKLPPYPETAPVPDLEPVRPRASRYMSSTPAVGLIVVGGGILALAAIVIALVVLGRSRAPQGDIGPSAIPASTATPTTIDAPLPVIHPAPTIATATATATVPRPAPARPPKSRR